MNISSLIPQATRQRFNYITSRPFEWTMTLIDLILSPLQRLLGIQRMGYFFVLPNLLIFGIFILLPMLMNFYIAFTGAVPSPSKTALGGHRKYCRHLQL
ncbi:MAG: sugar ABC transporter permease, partial [Anaerolineae bacterium]|nr:sugar ABC transporter permease [Anaerolineae bacterium]